MSRKEIVTIGNVEGFAIFRSCDECVRVLFYTALDGQITELDFLVPHGLAPIWNREIVSKRYAQKTVRQIEQWIQDAEWHTEVFDSRRVRAFLPNLKAYANFLSPEARSRVVPWSTLGAEEQVALAFSSLSFLRILYREISPKYLRPDQQQQLLKRVTDYRNLLKSTGYFERKASEFADFWRNCLGTAGRSGDFTADMMHLIARMRTQVNPIAICDLEKWRNAAYQYAMQSFERGEIPNWATDYLPDHRISKVLEQENLTHLAREFPWKTQFHLDFSDAPPR